MEPLAALALDGAFEDWGLPALLETVQAAEKAGLAFIVLPDRIAAADGRDAWPDASLLAGWLSARTVTIGFLVATSTVGHQPYNLARRIASLDLLSGGRMGWLVRDGDEATESAAFSGPVRFPEGNDPRRIAEFVGIVRSLWEGWDKDALLFDKENARFLDPARMHRLDHKGPHFSVAGPLNVMRSPQDRPVLAAGEGQLETEVIVGEDGFTVGGATHRLLVAGTPAAATRLLMDLPDMRRERGTLRQRLGLAEEASA